MIEALLALAAPFGGGKLLAAIGAAIMAVLGFLGWGAAKKAAGRAEERAKLEKQDLQHAVDIDHKGADARARADADARAPDRRLQSDGWRRD